MKYNDDFKNRKKDYIVYNIRLAEFLIRKGFKLLKVAMNHKEGNEDRAVFFFVGSDPLYKAVDEFKERYYKQKEKEGNKDA